MSATRLSPKHRSQLILKRVLLNLVVKQLLARFKHDVVKVRGTASFLTQLGVVIHKSQLHDKRAGLVRDEGFVGQLLSNAFAEVEARIEDLRCASGNQLPL